MPRSPELLTERARGIIENLGYPDPPLDRTYGFAADLDYLDYVTENDHLAPSLGSHCKR